MRIFKLFCFLVLFTNSLFANSIDEIYSALQNNDRVKARELLEIAVKKPETEVEASLLLILLNTVESKLNNMPIARAIYNKLPSPSAYLFCLWFDDAITGGYEKKEPERMKFLNKVLNDKSLNGSIKAGLRYIIGLHYMLSNNIEKSLEVWEPVNSIKNWQFVGPFDNISGSGFNKEYGPLNHPELNATFRSNTNSKIKWFVPKNQQRDPWISTMFHVPGKEAVAYAQTFLYSEEAKEVIFALGATGTLKFWLNDKIMIEEQFEQRTELDLFKCKYKLKKGYNRVLIQLGYTYNSSYPNFIFRIIDKNGMPDGTYKSTPDFKPYVKDRSTTKVKKIKHFAQEYFENRIQEQPDKILNYIFLSKVYYRASLFNKAIEVLEQGKENCKNNILVDYELLMNYIKLGNRTELIKQLEHVRKVAPELILLQVFDFQDNIKKEDYDAAETKLSEIKKFYGEDSKEYLNYKFEMDVARKDYKSLVTTINKAYEIFPDNPDIIKYKYTLLKNVDNNPAEALTLLKDFCESNYNHNILGLLVKEYKNQGKPEQAAQLLESLLKKIPEALEYAEKLSAFYFLNQKYPEALKWNKYCLDNSPFNANYWRDRAYLDEAAGNKEEAIKDLTLAIHQNPNLFDAREKLRTLQGKKSIISYFKNFRSSEIIDDELKKEIKSDINFEYIFDRRNIILFKEGSYISHISYGVKLHNQKGIENWKSLRINENIYRQRLVIEKAQVVKKDGKRIKAERNYNEIVFPSLEIGDIILVEYRHENHVWGKLSKEFWDKYSFSSYVPIKNSSFRLYVPKDFKFEIINENFDKKPVIETEDEFVCYKWEFDKIPKVEYESMMPSLYNSGRTINISSIKSWRIIANWYKDLVLSNTVNDYILDKTYSEIFKNRKGLADFEKAKIIYNYILNNIKYSHIPFRQSNYVPQKPMITISTKLGDCKDLSLLYYALAKKAGIKTNLVLVNTRDTKESIQVPSIDFNHCIVKIDLGNNIIYQELTDENLPFGAMPNSLKNSQALIIPNSENEKAGNELIKIVNSQPGQNARLRTTNYLVNENKISLDTKLTLVGEMASIYRNSFVGLNTTEKREKVIDYFDNHFEKDLNLINYSFKNLDERNEPVIFTAKIDVENEVKSIGGLKILKLPFFDEIVSLDDLPEKERKHEILYWLYENNDLYESTIFIKLPENANIVEMPTNLDLTDKFIDYKLNIVKVDKNTLKIIRRASIKETNLPADYYPTLRSSLKKILKAEDIYIVYKTL